MFHYVNAITNTRGDALTGFFVRAIDTASGSAVSIFADQNGTPIQAVSGVANAAQVDSDGNASFYVDSGEYHLDIYATDSTTFIKRIENIPMVSEGDFVINSDLSASTGASLVGATGGGTVQDGLDRIGTFVGYDTGVGGTVTQVTSRTSGVTINKLTGRISLVSAAGTSAWQNFDVTNSEVSATDVVHVSICNATNTYVASVHFVTDGAFGITHSAVAGTATDAPTINFVVVKGAIA
jgi:hypothetical protein